ncbi:MAG: class I SAM-dependent methyltransferase [Solirubrobacteraceae bacterium]
MTAATAARASPATAPAFYPPGVDASGQLPASPNLSPADALRSERCAGYETDRPDVQFHVPRSARTILDLGCSSGSLGAALKRRQPSTVVGVEPIAEYARDAAERLDRVFAVDVESFLSGPAPVEAPFDCLIAADVLEHLVDPWQVLSQAAELLRPGGTAVISLPNVAYWHGLLRFVRDGRWPLDDQGVFDRTHLRWFTRDDALDLLQQAGLRPVVVEPRYWSSGWRSKWRLLAERTPLDRFLAPQYVISAIKVV